MWTKFYEIVQVYINMSISHCWDSFLFIPNFKKFSFSSFDLSVFTLQWVADDAICITCCLFDIPLPVTYHFLFVVGRLWRSQSISCFVINSLQIILIWQCNNYVEYLSNVALVGDYCCVYDGQISICDVSWQTRPIRCSQIPPGFCQLWSTHSVQRFCWVTSF